MVTGVSGRLKAASGVLSGSPPLVALMTPPRNDSEVRGRSNRAEVCAAPLGCDVEGCWMF